MLSPRRHTLGGSGSAPRAPKHNLSADELPVALPLRSLGCSPRCRNWMPFWCAPNTHTPVFFHKAIYPVGLWSNISARVVHISCPACLKDCRKKGPFLLL